METGMTQMWMLPAGFALVCLAVAALLFERHQRQGRWRKERRDLEQLVETLATQLADAKRRGEAQRDRRRAAERVLSRLAAKLESKPLDADDHQLLADLYHEYGTDAHEYYFPSGRDGEERR
jgi:glutathione S-transferase